MRALHLLVFRKVSALPSKKGPFTLGTGPGPGVLQHSADWFFGGGSRHEKHMSTMDVAPVHNLRRITNRFRKHSTDFRPLFPEATAVKEKAMVDAEVCDPGQVVCNLPELLAHDLEMSEGAFIRKNMTAGTPVQHLSPEDEYRQLYPGLRGSRNSADDKDALFNRLSLSAIEGQFQLPDIDEVSDYVEENGFTSDSSGDSFMAMEPPSVRMRNQSVATAATSVNINDCSPTSHCSSPKQHQRCSLTAFDGGNLDTPDFERSWFELGTPLESGDNTDDDDLAPESIPAQTMSNMEDISSRKPDHNLVRDLDADCPAESIASHGSLARNSRAVEHVDNALSPRPPSDTQLHPPHSRGSEGQSYLENKRAARKRGSDSIASLPSDLHINPLALNPSRFTRSEAVHDPSPTSPREIPLKIARADQPEERQRPSTASGIPPSSEKPRVIKLPPRQVISPGRSSVLALNLGPSFSFDLTSPERPHSPKPDSILAKRIRKALNRMSGRTFIDATASRLPAPNSEEGDESRAVDTIDDVVRQHKQDSRVRQAAEAEPTTEGRNDYEGRRKAQDQAFKEVKQILHPPARPLSPIDVSEEISDHDITTNFAGWIGPSTKPETPSLFTQLPPPGPGPEHTVRPGLPLPPHVIENLRVSVTGFPDTMLLISSLSIETIRAYAKKLRRPENSLDLSPLSPVGTVGSTSSRWKRSMGRTTSRAIASPLPPSEPNDLTLTRTTSSTTRPGPSWFCIKRVFPSGSDYRCEALYAHLLAYNYIATICGHDVVPLTLPVPSPVRRGTAPVHVRCASTSAEMLARTEPDFFPVVPKKAAHLLGIGAGSGSTTNLVRTASLKSVGRVRGFLKRGRGIRDEVDFETLGGKTGAKPGNEVALREVMTGLVKCVAALVRFLKSSESVRSSAGEEGDDDEEDDDDVVGLDMHMFRALCELVRAEEEMAE